MKWILTGIPTEQQLSLAARKTRGKKQPQEKKKKTNKTKKQPTTTQQKLKGGIDSKNGSREAESRKVEKNREKLTEFCIHHAASSIVLLLLGRKHGTEHGIYKNCVRFWTMLF